MHELGHNLGLTHGGCAMGSTSVICDPKNYKPNYLSVMNYLFQFRGLIWNGLEGFMGYSGPVTTVSENSLNEAVGIGVSTNLGTRYWCSGIGERPVVQANGPIDWNCDGRIDGNVSANIDGDGSIGNLAGANDWDVLVFVGGAVGQAGAMSTQPLFTPIEELEQENHPSIAMSHGISIASGSSLSVRPGTSDALTFIIENRGSEADIFKLSVTPTPSVASWVSTRNLPVQISLGPGAKQVVMLPVVVPAAGGFGEIALRAESADNPSVFDVGRIVITSGSRTLP